ncbi:hypothetical protein [Sinorhizobium medicae]|uniref:hypothetical protein n=1 Tax=Sinorhizobium medicae TaxID=110321 RepID=UPI000410CEEF|nr:hypothetical protein [Sinorhizobium medicae]
MHPKARILIAAVIFSVATVAPASISSADNYSGDYYGGVDINQREIKGQREPINKFLLKRRGAAQTPDPGAAGTIDQSQPRRIMPSQ